MNGTMTEELETEYLKAKANVVMDRSIVVKEIISYCRTVGLGYVVAPGEADHQLVYLSQHEMVDYVISVDSDMLCHSSVRLVRFLKGGFASGEGQVFDFSASVPESQEREGEDTLKNIITSAMLRCKASQFDIAWRIARAFAYLTGSDYHGLKGIGVKTAIRMLESYIGYIDSPDQILDISSWAFLFENDDTAAKSMNDLGGWQNVLKEMTEARMGFDTGLVVDLALTKRIAPLDDLRWTRGDPLATVALYAQCPDHGLLVALGLRCLESSCLCASDPRHRHVLHSQPEQAFQVDPETSTSGSENSSSPPESSSSEISRYTRLEESEPRALTYDMVPGSRMTMEQVEAKNTTPDEFKAWLRARGMPYSSEDNVSLNKNMLRDRVRAQLKIEFEDPSTVRLRCPDGRSLLHYLVERGHRPPEILILQSLQFLRRVPSSHWVSDLEQIKRFSPVVTESLLKDYYKKKDKNKSGKMRVLEDGYRRIASCTFLDTFCYLDNAKGAGTCAYKMRVPRSMVNDKYLVFVFCSVRDPVDGETLARIASIEAVSCPCPAGADGLCIHVSALLQAVQNLDRPIDKAEDKPCTSVACEWNKPSRTITPMSNRIPLDGIRFEKNIRGKVRKRDFPCHDRTGKRTQGEEEPWKQKFRDKRRRVDPWFIDFCRRFVVRVEEQLNEPCGFAHFYDPRLKVNVDTKYEVWARDWDEITKKDDHS